MGWYLLPNDRDVIPVEMKRLFVSETESDLQELSELIASYGRNARSPNAASSDGAYRA